MPNFGSAFVEAIYALGYGEAPERQLTPAEVSAEARRIAAAEGVKYKSVRRRIERRRTTAKQARGQPNRRFANQVRRRGLSVTVEGLEIDPSPDPNSEPDYRPRSFSAEIPGRMLGPMASALERGDLGAAERQFLDALLRVYEEVDEGEPSFLAGADVGDVDAMSIDWGDSSDD